MVMIQQSPARCQQGPLRSGFISLLRSQKQKFIISCYLVGAPQNTDSAQLPQPELNPSILSDIRVNDLQLETDGFGWLICFHN
jgi:hypothetical protein